MYQSSKPKNYGGGMIRGGMTTRPQMPKTVRTADGETIQSNVGKPPKVWRTFHGQGRGPIGIKPYNYSFFDLLTNPDDEELRRTSFEDWHFPEVIEEEVDALQINAVLGNTVAVRIGELTVCNSLLVALTHHSYLRGELVTHRVGFVLYVEGSEVFPERFERLKLL